MLLYIFISVKKLLKGTALLKEFQFPAPLQILSQFKFRAHSGNLEAEVPHQAHASKVFKTHLKQQVSHTLYAEDEFKLEFLY